MAALQPSNPTHDSFAKAYASIIRSDLRAFDVRVLLNLRIHQGKNEYAWPGIETQIAELRCDRKTLMDSLKRLEDRGLLYVERKAGTVNRYRIDLEATASKLALENEVSEITATRGKNGTSPKNSTRGKNGTTPSQKLHGSSPKNSTTPVEKTAPEVDKRNRETLDTEKGETSRARARISPPSQEKPDPQEWPMGYEREARRAYPHFEGEGDAA